MLYVDIPTTGLIKPLCNVIALLYVNILTYGLTKPLFNPQDRGNPEWVMADFHQVPFNAMLASQVPALSDIVSMPGVDGFVMDIDPLYKVRVKIRIECRVHGLTVS